MVGSSTSGAAPAVRRLHGRHAGLGRLWCRARPDAVALAVDRDLQVEVATIDDVDDRFGGGFDALTMFNVLEHVLDPWAMLNTAHELLRPGGVLVVQVPNDFSPLQEAVRSHLDVALVGRRGDHVNYFDFESSMKRSGATAFTRSCSTVCSRWSSSWSAPRLRERPGEVRLRTVPAVRSRCR